MPMTLSGDRRRQKLAIEHPVRDERWREDARCKYVTDPDFFSNVADERYRARALCYSECPVRKQCLQYALTTLQIDGIWGACDEYELRRTLGVDAHCAPVTRARAPRCPFCLNRELRTDGEVQTVNCDKCGIFWPIVK